MNHGSDFCHDSDCLPARGWPMREVVFKMRSLFHPSVCTPPSFCRRLSIGGQRGIYMTNGWLCMCVVVVSSEALGIEFLRYTCRAVGRPSGVYVSGLDEKLINTLFRPFEVEDKRTVCVVNTQTLRCLFLMMSPSYPSTRLRNACMRLDFCIVKQHV